MNTLFIEGKHLDSQGLAYARCSATGRAARVVAAERKEELGRHERIPDGLIRKAAELF